MVHGAGICFGGESGSTTASSVKVSESAIIKGMSKTSQAIGIYNEISSGAIEINGGTITADSEEAYSYAIRSNVYNNIKVTGGSVLGYGATYSRGIQVYEGKIDISRRRYLCRI